MDQAQGYKQSDINANWGIYDQQGATPCIAAVSSKKNETISAKQFILSVAISTIAIQFPKKII